MNLARVWPNALKPDEGADEHVVSIGFSSHYAFAIFAACHTQLVVCHSVESGRSVPGMQVCVCMPERCRFSRFIAQVDMFVLERTTHIALNDVRK